MSYTVIFEGSPKSVRGNPMTLETPFGRVEACGFASAFEQMEILEAALDKIAEGTLNVHEAVSLATDALEASTNLMIEESK